METGRWWLSEGRGVVWEWLLTGRGSWGDELEPGRGVGSAASQFYHVPPHGAPDTVAAAGFVAEFATRRTREGAAVQVSAEGCSSQCLHVGHVPARFRRVGGSGGEGCGETGFSQRPRASALVLGEPARRGGSWEVLPAVLRPEGDIHIHARLSPSLPVPVPSCARLFQCPVPRCRLGDGGFTPDEQWGCRDVIRPAPPRGEMETPTPGHWLSSQSPVSTPPPLLGMWAGPGGTAQSAAAAAGGTARRPGP